MRGSFLWGFLGSFGVRVVRGHAEVELEGRVGGVVLHPERGRLPTVRAVATKGAVVAIRVAWRSLVRVAVLGGGGGGSWRIISL